MSSQRPHQIIDGLIAQARRAHAESRFADAVRCYGDVLALEPCIPPLLYLAAMTRMAMGDHTGARSLMRRAVAVGGAQPAVLLLGGVTELATGELERAAVLIERAMAQYGLAWNPAVFRATLPDWLRSIRSTAAGYPGAEGHAGRPAPVAYGTEPVDAACPVCGSRPAVKLFSVTVPQSAAHFVRFDFNPSLFRFLSETIAGLWGGPECVIARCRSCGFGFAHPYVAGDAAFYATTYAGAFYPDDKWEFEVTRQALRARRDAGRPVASLLEIGVGKGAFITSLVPDLLPAHAVAFTEYSDTWRDRLTAQGFVSLPPDAARHPPEDCRGRFDAVCAFQVVEHCDRLDELFAGFTALTRPGASLFLAVPGEPMTEFSERWGGMVDMPPNHIGRWTPAALDIIARRHGWTIADCRLDAAETPHGRIRELQSLRYMREIQIPGSVAQILVLCPEQGVRNALQIMIAQFYDHLLADARPRLSGPALATTLWAHLVRAG